MTKVIAFDVNETLLDLRALDAAFEELLGSAALRGQWFAQMLQLSFVGGLTGNYVDFSDAQQAALHMLGERQGVTVSDDAAAAMVGRMNSLPPHPEVPGALKELAGTSLTVVALVNSLQSVGEDQLANAGIRGYFERVISADSVKALKPRQGTVSWRSRTHSTWESATCAWWRPIPGTCPARSPPAAEPRSSHARGWS